MLSTILSLIQIALLLAIVALLIKLAGGSRPLRLAMPGVMPGPMAWELKRLHGQIESVLNWGNN